MIAAALYVTPSSVYRTIDGVDCFDEFRDARTYRGWLPVVAHPPCRAWGRLRHLAKPRADELALGLHAVQQVRRCTGVLEHPAGSKLWAAAGLPLPSAGVDQWGGFSVALNQSDYGHPARKSTWLYVVSDSSPGDFCKALRAGALCEVAVPGGLRKVANQPAARRMDTPSYFARLLVSLVSGGVCKLPLLKTLQGVFVLLIGYARVSTVDQDTALQLDALAVAGVRSVYVESGSGAGHVFSFV